MKKKSVLTRDTFKERLKKLNMSQIEFAKRVGYSSIAVKKWQDEQFPGWVDYVLKYFELAADARRSVNE